VVAKCAKKIYKKVGAQETYSTLQKITSANEKQPWQQTSP
jgi:hypothetical protein